MPMGSRAASLLLGAVLTASAPASAQHAGTDELQHAIDQSFLYMKMKVPARARELLERTVAQEPGRSDALVWLAYARARNAAERFDIAGEAVRRARTLGIEARAAEVSWVAEFLRLFTKHVGAVELSGDRDGPVTFRLALAAPMLDPDRRAIFESLEGFSDDYLTRDIGKRFYLPAGRYVMGKATITVRAGQMSQVSLSSVEVAPQLFADPLDESEPEPAAEPRVPSGLQPPAEFDRPEVAADPEIPAVPGPVEIWLADNWGWIAAGAGVAAAGVAVGIVAGNSLGSTTYALDVATKKTR